MEIMDLYTAALIRLASMLQCTNYVAMGANPDKERKNERIYVHAFSLALLLYCPCSHCDVTRKNNNFRFEGLDIHYH